MESQKIISVALPVPLEQDFSYLYSGDSEILVNQIVKVSFRHRMTFGVVTQIQNVTDQDISKLKTIESVTDFVMKKQMMEFISFVAEYNIIPRGMVLKMALSAPKAFEHNPRAHADKIPKVEEGATLATLSEEQKNAYLSLKENSDKSFSISVLEGVTGSGKTEVYLTLIEDAIAKGKQILILLPEILLTTQLVERFKKRLSVPIMEWHSSLTPKQRISAWRLVYSGDVKIIVGARSALFLPFKDLALIVVDEEHEPSFKQEENGSYHARDMAIARAKIENVPIILTSATPSIETEHNVREGKYKQVFLPSRFGGSIMPEVHIIDLLKNKPPKGQWITSELRTQIKLNYESDRQTLLYINRRGYAMMTMCGECRQKIACPHCDFNLVKHRSQNMLLCHYCGYTENGDLKCKSCGSTEKFYSTGPGVEKIAEEVLELLPEARVEILSSDTLTTRNKARDAIDKIMSHEVDIIVGTQMITKGLHFPKLDLVGVIDADLNLFSGDIRAFERTYQVLKQVAGRAGRESEKGLVYLQTLQPESYLIDSIKNQNWTQFIDNELENRELAHMPPFTRIVMINFSAKEQEIMISYTRALSRVTPDIDGIKFLGPTPAPLFLLRGRYRYRFIVVADKKINIQKVIKTWLNAVTAPKSIEVRIDVDPLNFS